MQCYLGKNMDMQKCTFEDAANTLTHIQGDEENKLLKDESQIHTKKHFLCANTSERRMSDGPWRPHVIRDCNPVMASLISSSKS